MLAVIREISAASDYDFREFACPEDPLSGLFEQWVPCYRQKWATARALRPSRILEVGVRFGYSARAFLDGYAGARYVGIDVDAESWGGCKGAVRWAQSISRGRDASFVIADSQLLERLPGNDWDLIHIDGQQDPDAFFADGSKALLQGRYILLDGYPWTTSNFQAANELLRLHRELIEWWGVIPGYAGDLLICTSRAARRHFSGNGRVGTSSHITGAYTASYYLSDCGGFDAWLRGQGKSLDDPRLAAMAALAGLRRGESVLDLGCGRGELTYALARPGRGPASWRSTIRLRPSAWPSALSRENPSCAGRSRSYAAMRSRHRGQSPSTSRLHPT
jgi:SAM-dependent methyltransferase